MNLNFPCSRVCSIPPPATGSHGPWGFASGLALTFRRGATQSAHCPGCSNRRLSTTFPALIHERAEINESCYGCGRINFHKYSHKHDNLKNSAVYRMVHGLDDQPAPAIADRPEKMQAVDDYYQAAARVSTPLGSSAGRRACSAPPCPLRALCSSIDTIILFLSNQRHPHPPPPASRRKPEVQVHKSSPS